MRLLVVGLSHRTAPVELRECVDFSKGGLDAALAALAERGLARESVVLSTCNRAEVYAVVESEAETAAIARFFSDYHRIEHEQMAQHLYALASGDAAMHLFRVAAGLDSLVVGEPQILGQVKAAYATASECTHKSSASYACCPPRVGMICWRRIRITSDRTSEYPR